MKKEDKKEKNWLYKIRPRFVMLSVLIFGIISFFIYIYFTDAYRQQKVTAFNKKIDLLVDGVKLGVNLGATSRDTLALEKVLNNVLDNHIISYLIITNQDGKVLETFNMPKAVENKYLIEDKEHNLLSGKGILKINSQIKMGQNNSASFYLGYPLAGLHNDLEKHRLSVVLICLGIFTVGVIFFLLVLHILIRPLKPITNSVHKIALGDLNQRFGIKGKGELYELSRDLNTIVLNYEHTSSELAHLNRQLKTVFKDKIGELNLEIKRRRQMESSLKQSEEQFRLLVELAPVGMVISSPDGFIQKVNQAFSEMIGYSQEEINNWPIQDLTNKEDWEFESALLNKLMKLKPEEIMDWPEDEIKDWNQKVNLHKSMLKEQFSDIYLEKRFIRKDNKIIHTITQTILLRDEKGEPYQFVSQVIDITQRKKFESELIVAKEKAEESDRLKSAFLAQMSHEIRTPLNVILNATAIVKDELEEGGADDEVMVIADSMNHAGKRLQRTIDLILNISSVQAGTYEPQFEKLDVKAELLNLIEEFKPLAKEKNLSLKFTNKTKDSVIDADQYTINQIFQNLIDNAIKYTQKGEVKVTLSKNENNRLTVDVADTGIGMSDEFMRQLFTPFSQEDVGQKREFEGNGLGLALVKNYVEINKADIIVNSEKHKGSSFTIIFKS